MRTCVVAGIALLSFVTLVAGQTNLLSNPGFEIAPGAGGPPAAWTVAGNAGTEYWAARSGTNGLVFRGWDPGIGTPAYISQEVPVTPGTYTFAAWVLKERNFSPRTTEMRLDWLNAGGGTVQVSTVANWIGLPNDGSHHVIYVTGTCTNPALARVRATLYQVWTQRTSVNLQSFMVDDTELYAGPVRGSRLANGSFEQEGFVNGREWRITGFGGGIETWANRSGLRGIGLWGWAVESNEYTVTFFQNLLPGTGTFSFAIWGLREENFLWTNLQLRIEWYDRTFTNKVQADSVSNFPSPSPSDTRWLEYWVTGTCLDTNLYEARAVVQAQFVYNSNNVPARGGKLDDARWLRGAYDGTSMNTDWIYHSAWGYDPTEEEVPGTNGFGPFFQINYVTRTNTYYLLTPVNLAKYAEEDAKVELRTAWQVPGTTTWREVYTLMEKVATVDLTPANPFHGLPTAGTQQVAVWRCYWEQPRNPITGEFYTNQSITVFYSPFIKITNGVTETSYKYMTLRSDGSTQTNNLGQRMGNTYMYVDYFYVNFHAPAWAVFTNGNFDNPWGTDGFQDTGWFKQGAAGRELWARKGGDTNAAGAAFYSWDPDVGKIYQDVAVTTGDYVFCAWHKVQPGAQPTSLVMKMEWYDRDGVCFQRNVRSLMDSPRGSWWNKASVMGSCRNTNVHHVRLAFVGVWDDGTEAYNEGIMFDDAEFYALPNTLQNPGFEIGAVDDDGVMPGWTDGYTVQMRNWNWQQSDTKFAAFTGWETNELRYQSYLAQPVRASNGVYTLSCRIRRESGFLLTNAQLRIEWFNQTLTNKVQADTIAVLTVPNDAVWRDYVVTGTCENASLYALRAGLFVQWDRNLVVEPRAMGVDDFSLTWSSGTEYVDGIPVWWLQRWGLGLTNGVGAGDDDEDGQSNADEYVVDTDPTDPDRNYVPTVAGASGGPHQWRLTIGTTTNTRVYDVWWRTNLVPENAPWTPMGLNVPGTGGALEFTVTNDVGQKFYRTGVRVP